MGRLRIEGFAVRIEPEVEGDADRLDRCLEIFENFCTVAESVRRGIDVQVAVEVPAAAAGSD